ncbi:MAG: hypothetical protein NZ529_09110 [Cytophagaceae bacterium]|nr:hypothetical protein [Cytophagaceae bacterium]MDW8456943.1 hypothetical protein [Cytophagaceae bacterium]
MNQKKLDIEKISELFPKTWKDINQYFYQLHKTFADKYAISFADLPFQLQLGVFISYFEENGTSVEINNLDQPSLIESIEHAFARNEQSMSHYS